MSHPSALLIHGPAGGVVVPLIEVQALREALATTAASFAVREVESKWGKK